jgi:hypothetical protein
LADLAIFPYVAGASETNLDLERLVDDLAGSTGPKSSGGQGHEGCILGYLEAYDVKSMTYD